MDLELKERLLSQLQKMKNHRITGSFIQNNNIPRYYSGRLYQEGDVVLRAGILIEDKKMVIEIADTEIDYYAFNYHLKPNDDEHLFIEPYKNTPAIIQNKNTFLPIIIPNK